MEEHHLALKPGYQLDHFRIEAMLGKGGFGITYLALDLRLGKKVAIKELLPDSIATRVEGYTVVPQSSTLDENWQWARQRFLEEARVLAGFSHPAIVGVHLLLEAHGTVYMVMDYVEGESYEARLRRIGREPDQASLMAVMGPILDGLEEVHAKGLLHRDIKPENILINARGQPVLIDFGSARESVGKTMTMTSIVTHGYSPIEQYQTKGRMGPWTDIYSMGAVMCRAVTGEKPPVAADRIDEDEFAWLTYRELPGFSKEFRHAIDWALRVKVQERPKSVADFRAQLNSIPGAASTEASQKFYAPPPRSVPPEPSPQESVPELTAPQVIKSGSPKLLIPAIVAAVIALLVASAGALLLANQMAKRSAQQASVVAEPSKGQEEALASDAARAKAESEQRAARAKKDEEKAEGRARLSLPVHSVAHGLVVCARDARGDLGRSIIVRHAYWENNKWHYIDSAYSRLEQLLVSEGMQVKRGQQIGSIGTHVNTHTAHLHFEIRKNLRISLNPGLYSKSLDNYHEPDALIANRRDLYGGNRRVNVPINTFSVGGKTVDSFQHPESINKGTFVVAPTRSVDGFDMPLREPEASGFIRTRGFEEGIHMGIDWGLADQTTPQFCGSQ